MSEQVSERDRGGQLETILRNGSVANTPARVPVETGIAFVPATHRAVFGNKSSDQISFGYSKSSALRLFLLCGLLAFGSLLYARNPNPANHMHFLIGVLMGAFCLLGSLKSLYRLLEDEPVFILSSYGVKIRGYADESIRWNEVASLEVTRVRRYHYLTFHFAPTFRPVRANWSLLGFLGKFAIAKRDGVRIILTHLDCDPEQIAERCARYIAATRIGQVATSWNGQLAASAPATMQSEPLLTYVLIALLLVIYAAEVRFAVTPGKVGLLSIPTLVLSGATAGRLMSQHADWWRLFTAPLLHGGLAHLLGNCLALFFVGRLLERLVGWRWMSCIFAASALAGFVGSVWFNGPRVVGTGASGAIMGLLAALFILSFRFPKDTRRYGSQILAAQFLIPSLIPVLRAEMV